ncbi:MAG: hypothetical protein WBL44_01425 [Nitrososphaeraceae archaeon]|jgi:hypothetical protein
MDTESENNYAKVQQNDRYDDMLRNLRQRLAVARRCGEPNYNRSPDLTSISVELTSDLIRSILSIDEKTDLDPKFRNKISTEIRVPMEEIYGITIPSIKFKIKRSRVSWLLCCLNPDKHAYSIKFRETIVDQGRTSLDIDLVIKRLKKVIEDNVAEFV